MSKLKVSPQRLQFLVELAERSISYGFVPIPLIGKRPVTKGWQNFRNDSRDPLKNARRVRHLIEAGAANNIGAVTGEASGIVVLDVEKDGLGTWNSWLSQYGKIPETFTVRTGKGGLHIYFRYDDHLKLLTNASKIKGKEIDFKTNGGMVVLPGSIVDDKQYLVLSGYENNVPILASMPQWLYSILKTDQEEKMSSSASIINTYHTYFRHAPRLNNNLDPPIKPGSEEQIYNKSLDIYQNYQAPIKIITSPYLRCRQTAQIMSNTFNPNIPIEADPRLGEKLVRRKLTGQYPPGEYDPETIMFGQLPPAGETDEDVTRRISQHLQLTSTMNENIWFVTHGAILDKIAKLYGIRLSHFLPPLASITIPRQNYNEPGFTIIVKYSNTVLRYNIPKYA